PGGGSYYAGVGHNNLDGTNSAELWVALAEKAYAQENESGWIGTNTPGVNSYPVLSWGNPAWALSAITGLSTASFAVTGDNLSSAWNSGKLIVLGTPTSPASSMIADIHAYAVVGYNPSSSTPFTVFNPWGIKGISESYPQYDLFNTTASFLAQNFAYGVSAGA